MEYTSNAPPVRSLDVEGTPTVNARRYDGASAEVFINPQGLPVAFRRVRVLKPGTFAGASRDQLVTPWQVVGLSPSVADAFRARCHPLN